MHGFVDLHCHVLPGVDEGARTDEEASAMLVALHALGFSTVVATPHMRPGRFENSQFGLQQSFAGFQERVTQEGTMSLPTLYLASEHYIDDVVVSRIMAGQGLPYPGGGVILIEFSPTAFPLFAAERLFAMQTMRLTPLLAHPERYQPVWEDPDCLSPLRAAGVELLLDLGALVGKYGKASQTAAEKLLAARAYTAACSDAHRLRDVESLPQAIDRLACLVGAQEQTRLLQAGAEELCFRKGPPPRSTRASSPQETTL